MTVSRLFWQVPAALVTCVLLLVLVLLVNECAVARPSKRTKDIAYREAGSAGFSAERHILDVYAPTKKRAGGYPVVLFIHGGSWNSGNKNIYWFIGRRLAKQGVVAVIINYRLAPNVLVPAMADDCADAVLWTARHIAEYGGDPNRIFTMGHSAGGGLAALMAAKHELFVARGLPQSPVKGAILDDPAGLDMYDYLQKMAYPNDEQYLVSFGKEPAVWRSVSPMYFIDKHTPPMLLYTGTKTYPSIISSTGIFDRKLTELGVKHTYTVMPGKKHVPMVAQLFWANNLIYRDLLTLVNANAQAR
ncbi:alpha/beta hydrolase [Spirosoma rigui]|uniref:alpha/beta hydrolase n=1 Tax=Spirosoma rigui TaxID=564064 RepID=UPI0009AF8BBC|nr:alpha/beta hydrolase [Spirosoma rigui]